MKRLFTVLLTLVTLLLAGPVALTQGTYTQIDVPGSTNTFSFGINSLSEITGYYGTSGSGYSSGYILSNGTFTTISYGPNTSTLLRAINDNGKIVGETNDDVAFIFDEREKTFTTIPCGITPTAINNYGVIVGLGGVGVVGSKCIYRLPPNAGANAEGITADGTVVGFAQSNEGGNFVSFAYQSGRFMRVRLPYPSLHLSIYGVSSSGNAVVATSVDSASSYLVDQSGAVQVLSFPGASFTWATGVNDSGEVVGSFTDSSNMWHGFTWTPDQPLTGEKVH